MPDEDEYRYSEEFYEQFDNINQKLDSIIDEDDNVKSKQSGSILALDSDGNPVELQAEKNEDGDYILKTTGTVEIANVNTEGSMPVRSAGISNFAIDVITIDSDTDPIELKAGAEPLSDRYEIQIYPPDSGEVFIGESDVTEDTGLPLASDDPLMTIELNTDEGLQLYAINDGTSRDIRVVEIA